MTPITTPDCGDIASSSAGHLGGGGQSAKLPGARRPFQLRSEGSLSTSPILYTHALPGSRMSRLAWRLSAAILMVAIFLVDTLTPIQGAVAVLYVLAILLATRTHRRYDILTAAVGATTLAVLSYAITHGFAHLGAYTLRGFVSLSAITIASVLSLQNQRGMEELATQAILLDLSHDMIFVRDRTGIITFWNRTAEDVYGWSPQEAVGRVADELLSTQYPDQRESIEAELVKTGRWEGVLKHTTRSGCPLVLDSRWVIQRDQRGHPMGVMETHTDVTDRRAAYAALVRSERRYRRMFDASRLGILQE